MYLEERATVERYRAERAHHVQKARSALETLAKGIELGPTPRLDDFSVSSMSSSASLVLPFRLYPRFLLHSPRKARPEVEVEEEIAPYADESSEAQVDKTKREVPYSDTIVQVQEAGAEQEAGTGAEHIARDAEEEKKKREEKKEIETQKQHLLAMLAEHQKDAEVQRMEMENSMKEHLRQLAAQEAFNRSREMEKMRTELEHVKAKDGQLSRVERDFEELKKIQLEKNAELEILQRELAMKREGEQAELERLRKELEHVKAFKKEFVLKREKREAEIERLKRELEQVKAFKKEHIEAEMEERIRKLAAEESSKREAELARKREDAAQESLERKTEMERLTRELDHVKANLLLQSNNEKEETYKASAREMAELAWVYKREDAPVSDMHMPVAVMNTVGESIFARWIDHSCGARAQHPTSPYCRTRGCGPSMQAQGTIR